MEDPYFVKARHPIRYPLSQSPNFVGGVPACEFDPSRETLRDSPPESIRRSKVVQVPVHFVGSEQPDRASSASKVQKVFRGFLVRNCLKKIGDIKSRVDEIEARLGKSGVMERVRRDSMEGLRMNEELMSLLLKLDLIRCPDFGVRSFRKAVIGKAIALQERIDAIVADGKVEVNTPENGGNPGDGEVDFVDREVKVVSEGNYWGGGDENETGDRELLVRITQENEKMMKMMTQMFEMNESQSRMINALTNRVEMLEKALIDERTRKKGKNKNKN